MCQFQLNSANCLDHTVDVKGFKPEMTRLASLIQTPSPTNILALRSWIGVLQSYSGFTSNLTEILSALSTWFQVKSLEVGLFILSVSLLNFIKREKKDHYILKDFCVLMVN